MFYIKFTSFFQIIYKLERRDKTFFKFWTPVFTVEMNECRVPEIRPGYQEAAIGGKCVFCELQPGETPRGTLPYNQSKAESGSLWLSQLSSLTHGLQNRKNLSLCPLCLLWGRSFLPPSTLTGHSGHPLLGSRPPLLLWCS